MDTRLCTKAFMTDFIETYHKHPCLWMLKDTDYTDKQKKAAAYTILIDKLKQVDPDATRDSVVKKINNLRSSFRKERKKIVISQKSGDEEVYKPTLWYFDLLLFLSNQEEKPRSRSYLSTYEETAYDTGDESEDIKYDPTLQPIFPTISSSLEHSAYNIHLSSTASTSSNCSTLNKRKMGDDESEHIFAAINRKLDRVGDEDQFEATGRNIAAKLRNLDREQRIYAEKMINDVLFEAELGTLHRGFKLVDESSETSLKYP